MNEPLWTPPNPETTQMWQFMRYIEGHYPFTLTSYDDLQQWSIEEPASFWQALCDFFNLRFDSKASSVLEHGHDMLKARWFSGAHFNFAQQLLSRKDDKTALIAVNEQGHRETLSYQQLHEQVAAYAAGLKAVGIQKGDRVAAVMPNIPTTIIAMLASASIGAVFSSCSPDFGAQAIIDRLGQIKPKLLFICDGHRYQGKNHPAEEKIKQMAQALPELQTLVLCPVLDIPLSDAFNDQRLVHLDAFKQPNKPLEFVSLPFAHPLYILFSSGTTGQPKCIIHGAGGTLLQHIKELALHCDIKEEDNLCFYTTCGWMMWNWMVSTLALGATLTLYEGSPTYPDAGRLFKLIEEENITLFGTSAKFISSVEKEQVKPGQQYKLDSLRCILSTGSPLLPKNYDFVYQAIKNDVQLASISGGTDIISCFALANPIKPVYRGELQCLGLGMAVEVFDEQGHPVEQQRGELVCTRPFPSMPIGFWNDPEQQKYRQAYFERFPGVWAHGDYAELTAHHGLIIYGRSDAILNPGGVRIGTAEIYRQVEKITEVLDSVVIGQNWQDDVRVVLFVKLQPGVELNEALLTNIKQTLRKNASPRHVPAKILQVNDIPRTINGKIVELAVRQTVHGEKINNLESIANPEALEDFKNRTELKD